MLQLLALALLQLTTLFGAPKPDATSAISATETSFNTTSTTPTTPTPPPPGIGNGGWDND